MLVLVFWHSLEKRPCKHFYWFQSKGSLWKIFQNTLSFCVYVQHTTAIGLLEFYMILCWLTLVADKRSWKRKCRWQRKWNTKRKLQRCKRKGQGQGKASDHIYVTVSSISQVKSGILYFNLLAECRLKALILPTDLSLMKNQPIFMFSFLSSMNDWNIFWLQCLGIWKVAL